MLSETLLTVKPVAAVSVAFMLGASDAESGSLCLSELYFVERRAVLNYVAGFEAVAGETMLSKQTKVLYGALS